MKKQLVYLSYNSVKHSIFVREIKFSILSALSHSGLHDIDICVYSDAPEAFAGWPVKVREITKAEIQVWHKSEINPRRHRAKLYCLEDGILNCKQSIFLDSDTFFLESPGKLFDSFTCGEVLVDKIERIWGSDRVKMDPYYAKIVRHLDSQNLDQRIKLLNSGVLGLFREDLSILREAQRIYDSIQSVDPDFVIVEQTSFSLAVHGKRNVIQQDGLVHHYFARRTLLRMILNRFFDEYGEDYVEHLPREANNIVRIYMTDDVPSRIFSKLAGIVFGKAVVKPVRFYLGGVRKRKISPIVGESLIVWTKNGMNK